jgi:hypothetical protein
VKRFLIAAALAALLVAAPASASAPGDRASAAAIRQATIDLHFTVTQQAPAIQAAVDRIDTPACRSALRHLPEDQADALVSDFLAPLLLEIEFDPLKRSFAAFTAKLDAIPMRDAALRSGRAGWRDLAAALGRFSPPPTDACAQLDAWRKACYPAASRPKIDDPAFTQLLTGDDLDRIDARLTRAAKRLQELGVSERVIGWWTLDTLLDDIEPDDDLPTPS